MAAAGSPVELLDCIVSQEWAIAAAGVNTGHLEAAMALPDLWLELKLLERLLYKNANQHRGSQHYKRLQEVCRLLKLLRDMQLARRAAAFHAAFQSAKQRGMLPTGSVLMAYGGDQRRLPSHSAAASLLHTLLAGCQLVEHLGTAVHLASLQLLAQLAHSFFMPLCLTALAALARIQVLTGQMLLDAVKAYNALAEAAALLPSAPGTSTPGAAQTAAELPKQQARERQLPQMLRALWRDGVPVLEAVPCPAGDSLAAQAAAACARYGLHVLAPEAEDGLPAKADLSALDQLRHKGRRPMGRGGKPAPVLAVVEDRGMPISRELFAAAATEPAAAGSAAEDVGVAAEPDCEQDGPDKGTPMLLGVVEDCQLEEGPSGVVSSLMEGEARGHLYRRATAGLGLSLSKSQQETQQKQQATVAGASSAAVATEQGKRAAAGAAGQQLPAAPMVVPPAGAAATAAKSATKPAALAVALQPPAVSAAASPADAAVKPAFLSAAAAAPRPAFLSVDVTAAYRAGAAGVASQPPPARPTAPTAVAAWPSTAAGKAPFKPAHDVAPAAAAAPLALAGASARKRKKPAAATGSEAAPEVEPAAAAPRSWEDWLAPLGGSIGPSDSSKAAGAAAAQQQRLPSKQQQQQQQQGKRRRGR